MRFRSGLTLALVLSAGCASLPTTGDGVVELVVELPADLSLEPGETRQLVAHAYDRSGSAIDVPIEWSTPDTTVTVNSSTGLVTGVAASGSGRVQAVTGTLLSNVIVFTLVAPPTDDGGTVPPDGDPDPGEGEGEGGAS